MICTSKWRWPRVRTPPSRTTRERLGEEVVEQVGAVRRRSWPGRGARGTSNVRRRRSSSESAWISGSRRLTTGAIDSSTLSFLPSPACSSLLNRPIRPSMLPAEPVVSPAPSRRTIPRMSTTPDGARGPRTLGPGTAGSLGARARARRGRRDRAAARDHARRGRGRPDRRRRGAAVPRARGGRRRVRARRPAAREDQGLGRRGARRDLPVRGGGTRALGLAVPTHRDRARPGLPHRLDHQVRTLDRARRLRLQGPSRRTTRRCSSGCSAASPPGPTRAPTKP